ncbi:MAG: hypothetical protein WC386_03200 [Candidatus Paceibacterota bacterium]|jgi:chromosome segregation ATPase
MEELLLDKEKIRTMRKDMQEAEGILIYPREEESVDLTQCFVGKKNEEGEITSEVCAPEMDKEESVEEERKKAEDLAYELALSTKKSEDNIKEKVLQEEPVKKDEAIFAEPEIAPIEEVTPKPEFGFMEIPQEEPVFSEPEPMPEEIKIEEKVPDLLPVEEKLPSAKELGLEEAETEKIPTAEELGLVEAAKEKENEELKKIDENEVKLEKIAETAFELEEKLKKVTEEKAPFEKRRMEIDEEINNIKKKLDLILERKAKVDEIKKDLEAKESIAQTPEEKRATEKERWKVEDDRNTIEKEKDEKEDEIKSLRLQMRECELNSEKVLVKEKEINQELEILRRDRDRILLGQTKQDLLKRLEPLEGEIEKIKREMFENTKLKDKSDKGLNDIKMREKAVEDEIKILERRQAEAKDEVILRDIETRRRTIEESRRQLEKDRWDVEDKMGDLEEKRKLIKEKYQEVAAQVKQIKAELTEIEEKIK